MVTTGELVGRRGARHRGVAEVLEDLPLPDDVPDPAIQRQVLRLDLSGEVFATFREAMAKIRRDAGESLDDDAAILLLCRQLWRAPRTRAARATQSHSRFARAAAGRINKVAVSQSKSVPSWSRWPNATGSTSGT